MTIKWISQAGLRKDLPRAGFKENVDLREMFRPRGAGNQAVMEFIGTADFAHEFFERAQFEVEAGRQRVPMLYPAIYDVIEDASLPKHIPIYQQKEAGVIFEEVAEGGEVKFASLESTSKSAEMKHYGAGIEYHKDFVVYNQFWQFPAVERKFGEAHNALMNHIHLNPILTATYGASNQTAASASGSTLTEKIANTLDDAVEHSKADTTNGRRGPYALLIAGGDSVKIANALNRAIQDGREQRYAGHGAIQTVIEYDGWNGTRGKKAVTYSGVTQGKVYLISLGYREEDFRSWMKQPLMPTMGNPDVSRFILEQIVYDSYFTTLAYPLKAVEEVTLPTS